MHPPEAHSPAKCSDAAQREGHYFEFFHGKLHHVIAKSSRRVRDNEAPAALAAGVSVLTKRCEPLQLRLDRRRGSFFRLVGRQRFR